MIIESIYRKVVNDLVIAFSKIYNHTNVAEGKIYPICDL